MLVLLSVGPALRASDVPTKSDAHPHGTTQRRILAFPLTSSNPIATHLTRPLTPSSDTMQMDDDGIVHPNNGT